MIVIWIASELNSSDKLVGEYICICMMHQCVMRHPQLLLEEEEKEEHLRKCKMRGLEIRKRGGKRRGGGLSITL